jgi:hypothetical protein
MIDFNKLYANTKTWYTGLPWYWKVLAVFVLLLVAALWVIVKLWPSDTTTGNADALVTARTDEALAEADADAEKLTAELVAQKEKVLEGLVKADEADAAAGERRVKILAASSMDELDKLQKEYGL